MEKQLANILSSLSKDDNDIYYYNFNNHDQQNEIILREKVASLQYDDYLNTLSKHHSIHVMDKEVNLFLKKYKLMDSCILFKKHGRGAAEK